MSTQFSTRFAARFFQNLFALLSLCLGLSAGAQSLSIGMSEAVLNGLTVTLVYPTTQTAQTHSFGAFQVHVAMNAPVAQKLSNGRLIVMSHGTGGSAVSDHELAAKFAHTGFVVAQPLHQSDNYLDSKDAGPVSFARRPLEVLAVIEQIAKDARFSSWLKTDKVGVHGMSAGGVTALSLAGGQWRLLDLIKHCAANTQADAGFCLNGIAPGAAGQARREERLAQYRSATRAPEAFLPASLKKIHPENSRIGQTLDARIAAISLTVPVGAVFSPESLKAIAIPVGLVTAGLDEWLVPRFHSEYLLAHIPKAQTLSHLPFAAHMDLLGPWPKEVADSLANSIARGAAVNPAFDTQDRSNAFDQTVKFMKTQLLR